jgi:hypothetical protein
MISMRVKVRRRFTPMAITATITAPAVDLTQGEARLAAYRLRSPRPKRDAAQLHERCDLMCPDLRSVL